MIRGGNAAGDLQNGLHHLSARFWPGIVIRLDSGGIQQVLGGIPHELVVDIHHQLKFPGQLHGILALDPGSQIRPELRIADTGGFAPVQQAYRVTHRRQAAPRGAGKHVVLHLVQKLIQLLSALNLDSGQGALGGFRHGRYGGHTGWGRLMAGCHGQA